VAESNEKPGANSEATRLGPDDRRWLHDKYERLAEEESQLASTRTSYYAAIGTVLITGLLLVIADLLSEPAVLTTSVTFLAALGILISFVWVVLLHRTNDAQNLWREAALRLEQSEPPIPGEWRGVITLRSGKTIHPNLLRPFETHRERFSPANPISWMDRMNPSALAEVLPVAFVGIWVVVLVTVWVWYLILR
jgi:hypothetical protein